MVKCLNFYPSVHRLFWRCGKCILCQLARSAEWSIRLLHESHYWDSAYFVTLTYSDEYLPDKGSLRKSDVINYIKRLRQYIRDYVTKDSGQVKYFCCGEYGSSTSRPHYHLIVFSNYLTSRDFDYYWNFGFTRVASVTEASIRYVVGYISKEYDIDYVKFRCKYSGIEPPFKTQSNGLGLRYCLDNSSWIVSRGYLTRFGFKFPLPRYYRKKLSLEYDSSSFDYPAPVRNYLDASFRDLITPGNGIYASYFTWLTNARSTLVQRSKDILQLIKNKRKKKKW